jgi:pimeloyl-ACP methyl ester carboxylesterase
MASEDTAAGETRYELLGRELRYRPVTVTTPDGLEIAAQDWKREGSGRDVLFIHGFAQSHLSWLKQVASPLADTFRLATYDLRGHGQSEKPFDPAYYRDTKRWADEADAVIQTLGLDRPVIVAWSYAGRVALDYLTAFGDDRVSGVVFVCATTAMAPWVVGAAGPSMRAMAAPELGVQAAATREFMRWCFAAPPPQDELEVMLAVAAATPREVRIGLGGRPAEYGETLAALRAPTLVLHGARDAVVTPAAGAYTARMVEGAEHLVYEGIGHAPFWEAPDRFNADLARFVNGLDLSLLQSGETPDRSEMA